MNLKQVLIGTAVIVLIPIVLVAWWLISPLFIDKSVDEELPFTVGAVIPADMTRVEVEQIMAGMAKGGQEMTEPMPAMDGATLTSKEVSRVTQLPLRLLDPGAPAEPTKIKSGRFRDADGAHKGSGEAVIYRGSDGLNLLRLENLQVTNGPALHVILSPHANPQSREDLKTPGYVDLGSLKGNVGNQNYPIPEGVDVDALGSVVIYCMPFHVIFSVASLERDAK